MAQTDNIKQYPLTRTNQNEHQHHFNILLSVVGAASPNTQFCNRVSLTNSTTEFQKWKESEDEGKEIYISHCCKQDVCVQQTHASSSNGSTDLSKFLAFQANEHQISRKHELVYQITISTLVNHCFSLV